ncbi:RHS repeat protein [[Pseudomonas] boreopolis]|uniref:RHS repeat domain-containing protein n=1 Tax=Xanthomonas boreopolis TaxID=86183 RepID=UPI003DA1BAD9
MSKDRVWLHRFGAATVLCAWMGQLGAVEPYQEYRKRIEAAQNMSALKSDLFGDSVSLYNGKTDFLVTDIDLPGNNGLPVQLSRRFSVELHLSGSATSFNANLEGAGGWDIEVPYISGTFSGGSWADTRCSVSMVPTVPSAFSLTEIWQGNTVHIPGGGDRTMLGLEGNTPKPSDGVARKWTTSQRDAVDCIPMVSGLTGEGFRVTTTGGIRYSFNQAVSRLAGTIRKTLGFGGVAQAGRIKIYLLATKVEDRFGNWVQYQYDGNGHPVRIWSNDGREITLTYSGMNLVSASANGRSWSYGYGSVVGASGSQSRLTSVTLPDSSKWTYAYSNALDPSQVSWDGNSTQDCAEQPPETSWDFTLTATHPSGATGSFAFSNIRHYRSGVHMSECRKRATSADIGTTEYYYELGTPNFFDVMTLTNKTISGPGLATSLKWTYNYGGGYQALWGSASTAASYPCTACATEKVVTVTNPDLTRVKYRYGFEYAFNEGKLLGSSTLDAAGNVVSVSTTTYMTAAQAVGKPFAPRYGLIYNGDDPSSAQVLPETGSTVQQEGVTFQSIVNTFDSLARPVSVTKASPWYTRTDLTEYYDDTVKWVLGNIAKNTNGNTGIVVSQTSYNSNAMPNQIWAFGKLQQTLTYNSDGTVATVADGGNHVTTLSGWKRGSPQLITYADGTSTSAVIDDNGWITSVTDENGYASTYGYDAMGRISSVVYPGGDSVAWYSTTQAFSQITATEYGLGAGHWRQVVSTGNARKEVYFDAFWRPVVSREYDNGNVAATQRFQRFAYDENGRQVFASYPGATDALTTGTWTEYDALGRTTSVSQDSELNLLTTTTQYLAGNQTRVTNPRGQVTVTGFQVFDQPDYKKPVWIQHPEGAYTDISRDLFGKPIAIVRRNADSTTKVIRSYVYDSYQQLCKSIEPETGATAMGYDGAGNVIWSAAGLSLPSTSNCDAQAAYDSGRRVDRTYDVRNRVKTVSFPDGNGNQSWTYYNDGKPSEVVTSNDAGSTQTVNTYTYNKRRLLTTETTGQVGVFNWSMGYGYNAYGTVANLTYPSGLSVAYAPNALGQPTQAGTYAIGVTYYPNGGMKQFTYGNGIVHTMTQNARQLPSQVTDSNGVLSNVYTYDAASNVAKITDSLDANRTRTMQYDGLNRLIQATSPSFGGDGVMKFTYDVLDNLRSAKLTGVKQHNYYYDAANRLTNVQDNAGATIIGLGYDVQGNLSNKNGQAFSFDTGNRLRVATGKESYRYDAQGRRVVSVDLASGGKIFSMYGQDGVLRRQQNERQSKNFEYIQLNGSLVARVTTVVAPPAPTLTAPSFSGTGSYAVSWNAVVGAAGYELQEKVNSGAWGAVYTGSLLSWSASGKVGATYSYRVRACQAGTCGNWSAAASTVVQLPPSTTTSITLAARSPNGNYSLSWGTIAGASTYKLEESARGGSWTTVQNSASMSAAYTGRAVGTYAYRVSGCNPAGCGPLSATTSTQTYYAPSAAPIISVPSQSLGGNYSVSWTTAGDADSYRLEESANGGAWTQIVQVPGTSQGFSGKGAGTYSYRVQACNGAGCGPHSSASAVSVILPPAAPTLSVPSTSNTGNYMVSWSTVAMTVSYRLEQSANGGSWGLIQDDGSTMRNLSGIGQGSYAYRVQGCNAAGCSGYSNTGTIVVTPPPATPSITSSIKYQWLEGRNTKIRCAVQWTASAGATSYDLAVAGNGLVQYSGPLTSISAAGSGYCAPSHVVRACNASGCSVYSSPPYTQGFEDLGGAALTASRAATAAQSQGEGE